MKKIKIIEIILKNRVDDRWWVVWLFVCYIDE